YFQYVENQGEYGIPFRCLIPRELENILVAGRSISATHEAMASFRVMAPCMAIGQAAGVASALTIQEGFTSLRKIPVDVLQRILKDQGAIL
ncbi:MAG TPA: FAD-dependent oxidoreductase, partial [Atribacter sp.]|uniref:FAD-dependent oxidoreductase n=1 Tax=Atribacter sp. TaxID=2847780 RepID=UPI002CBA0813